MDRRGQTDRCSQDDQRVDDINLEVVVDVADRPCAGVQPRNRLQDELRVTDARRRGIEADRLSAVGEITLRGASVAADELGIAVVAALVLFENAVSAYGRYRADRLGLV